MKINKTEVYIYDSLCLSSKCQQVMQVVRVWLENVGGEWNFKFPLDKIKLQKDGWSCGVWVCRIADLLCKEQMYICFL